MNRRICVLFGCIGDQARFVCQEPERGAIGLVVRAEDQPQAGRAGSCSCVCFISLGYTPYSSVLAGPSTLETIGVPTTQKTSATPPPPSAAEKQSAYAQQLAEVPEIALFGQVLGSSSTPAQLTESETEYQVTCVKHIFAENIVFQVCSGGLAKGLTS